VVDFGEVVKLPKILIWRETRARIDRTKERLQDGVPIGEYRPELELISQIGPAGVDVVAKRDMDFIDDIRIEGVAIGTDARLLEGKDA
jgi:hypothetical protein